MYIIQREAVSPIDNKIISISLNNENHNLLIQSFYNAYKKDGEIKDNVYIELVKTKNPGVRNSNDETIIKIELDVPNKAETLKNTRGFVKNIENLINKNMNQSLKEKVKLVEKLLEKYSDKLAKNKNPIYINEDFKEKVVKQAPIYQNSGNTTSGNYNNKNGESFKDKFNRIPLAYVIETLADMNVLSLEQEKKPNGDEDFYWIESDNLPKASKVSVLAIRTIENQSGDILNKYKHCRDLNNSKLTTSTAMGLLYSLQREGCLKGREVGDLAGEIIKHKGGFKAFPLVDEENEGLVMGEEGNVIDIVSLKTPSRLPNIYRTKNTQDYKDYLIQQRKISPEIIEREFKNGNIKTGTFTSHKNYTNINVGLFTLGRFDNSKKTFEKINFDRDGKLNRGHLSNISIKGRSHIIKNQNAKATIFTEAVIDNYSMENLMELSNSHNSKDYNYVGLTSVGNITGWFENNLDIKIKMKEDKKTGNLETQIFHIERSKVEFEDQESELKKIAKAINSKRIHFVMDKTKPWKEEKSKQALNLLQQTLKAVDPEIKFNIEVLDSKNFRLDNNKFEKGENPTDYILDYTNVEEFVEQNNIQATEVNVAKKTYEIKAVQTKERWVELTEDNIKKRQEIKQKVFNMTGNTNFIFSFDNDMAALPKIPHLKAVCEFFKLGYSSTIPTFQYGINDNNDILKTYVDFKQNGKNKEANQILEQFLSQIDTNKNKLPFGFEDLVKKSTAIELAKKKEKGNNRKRTP